MSEQRDGDPRDGGARTLADTQRFLAGAFAQFVPLTERDDLAGDIRAIVSGNDRLSPEQQAEIYREQFWLRHRDVLYDDYPGLCHLLGEAAFERFLRAYLSACPPDSYTLRNLGNRLAAFADDYPDFPPDVAAAAREMARFELSFVDVFDGPDRERAKPEDLAALDAEAWLRAVITFDPELTLMRVRYPVNDIRKALKSGEAPPPLAEQPTCLAIWRDPGDLRIRHRTVPSDELALLELLQQGTPLGEACARVAEASDDADALGASLQRWFKGWAMRGWILGIAG